MLDFTSLIKGPSHLKKAERDPGRDWMILVVILTLVCIGMTFWSVFLFFQLRSGDIFQKINPTQRRTETLDRSVLKDVVQVYNLKAVTFTAGGTRAVLTDPSK